MRVGVLNRHPSSKASGSEIGNVMELNLLMTEKN